MFRIRAAVVAIAAALAAGSAGAATLRLVCGSSGIDQNSCESAAKAWAQKTGNQVEFVSMPNNSSEALALYEQLLSSGSDKLDVLQIDTVWPGILANQLVDLKPYLKDRIADYFPSAIANDTVGVHRHGDALLPQGLAREVPHEGAREVGRAGCDGP
jgi:trehalose/maltose transport system substrate-binding protein